MTNVPGAGPVGVLNGSGRLSVTASAEFIQSGGGEPLGILNRAGRAVRLDVRGSRSVTGFAAHARLGRLDFFTFPDPERSGGVALEAVQDVGGGIEGAVANAIGIGVARR